VTSLYTEAMAQLSDRGVGDLQVQSSMLRLSDLTALAQGARNLVTKAAQSLGDGDVERVERYLDRAMRLPRSERNGLPSALLAARGLVDAAVTGAAREAAPGDRRWRDAAEAALPRCGIEARARIERAVRIATDRPLPSDDEQSRGAPLPAPIEDSAALLLVHQLLAALLVLEDELATHGL